MVELEALPERLKKYIQTQEPEKYSPVDHAVWRYILKHLKSFLKTHAHSCYLDGLEKTGISQEEIPSISDIDRHLQKFGWRAVPVSGFIPPAIFMELQSYSILPIASDMRSLDHLLYTPAPDIVHEAAGHAPILIHPGFNNYLKAYSQAAKKAIISQEDLDVYEAIRQLSDIKESPISTPEEILKAEKKLEPVSSQVSFTSEAALLARLYWWTAEYGLIGDLNHPQIFGAGLLSSLGESREYLSPKVKKIPLSLDCINVTYNITEPQPQLFVAENFEHLLKVLQELNETLSFKRGGIYGLEQAKKSKTINTIELNTGLQISGQLHDFIESEKNPVYLKFSGPTQICYKDSEITGHGKSYHSEGFGTPMGRLKALPHKCLSQATASDLENLGFKINQKIKLEFQSGVLVEGIFRSAYMQDHLWLLFTFDKALVSYKNSEILFKPEWGLFDMAVGESLPSVYAGAADRLKFGDADSFVIQKVPPPQITEENRVLYALYQKIRELRKKSLEVQTISTTELESIFKSLNRFPKDWLIRLEIYELAHFHKMPQLKEQVFQDLKNLSSQFKEFKTLIEDGLQHPELI